MLTAEALVTGDRSRDDSKEQLQFVFITMLLVASTFWVWALYHVANGQREQRRGCGHIRPVDRRQWCGTCG